MVVPTAGTISDLYVASAIDSNDMMILKMYKNESPTALTCEVVGPATTCNNTDPNDAFAVVAGDEISMMLDANSSTPAEASYFNWSWKFSSTTAKESILMGATWSPHASVTEYMSLVGTGTADTNQGQKGLLIPTSGTIKKLYVSMDHAPGDPGDSYDFTVRHDPNVHQTFVDSSITCQIADPNVACSDTSNTLAVAAGRLILLKIDPTNTPLTDMHIRASVVFLADTDGEFILSLNSSDGTHNTTTEKIQLSGGGQNNFNATAANRHAVSNAFTAKLMYVAMSGPGTAPNKYDITAVLDGDTTMTCEANAGNDGDCNADPADYNVDAGDMVYWQTAPFSSPTISSNNHFSLLGYIAPAAGRTRNLITEAEEEPLWHDPYALLWSRLFGLFLR
jgi:hypothetical protein